jgi:hypothetical protein
MKAKKPPKPTIYQTKILALIARSPLVKTYSADHKTIWALQTGREISEACANALIRNGWVRPTHDSLWPHDGESQTFVALRPPQ